jgi:hypothetical protein
MPRYSRWDDKDYGYDRAWDNYYNQCHCEWFPGEDSEDEGYEERCDYCKRQDAAAAAREAERKAWADAEEARLRATGWYDEITTMRGFINRFVWLTGPGLFQERLKLFVEMFTVLAGYEKFLAAHPKMRTVITNKIAECRANAGVTEELKGKMDELEALLAHLPAVEGYKE